MIVFCPAVIIFLIGNNKMTYKVSIYDVNVRFTFVMKEADHSNVHVVVFAASASRLGNSGLKNNYCLIIQLVIIHQWGACDESAGGTGGSSTSLCLKYVGCSV